MIAPPSRKIASIVGYGLTHIPGGMLATAIGMKKTLVLSCWCRDWPASCPGLSSSYTELADLDV